MTLSTTSLKTKVTALYGLSGDTSAEADALLALDEAISEMNMEMWEFLLSRQESIAMVANQNYVTIPSAMYKEKTVFVVRTPDGSFHPPLAYIDWPTYRRMYLVASEKGRSIPFVYSTFGDEARVYLGPTPNDDAADNHTLTIEYYIRLRSATVADADDQILDVPVEFEVPLLHKARQFYALSIAGPESPDVIIFQKLYDDAITNMRQVDRRHPDEVTRFRMYDANRGLGRTRRAGGIYTRID